VACCHKSGGQFWTPITPAGGQSSTPILTLARKAAARLREALLAGEYIAVQNEEGRTFIGTQDEAAEYIMGTVG